MIDNPGNLKLELTPDQLEAISGGTYTPEQEQELLGYLRMGKASGMTKEKVLSMVPMFFASLSSK